MSRSQERRHRNRGTKTGPSSLANASPAGIPLLAGRSALWISLGLIAANLFVYAAVRRFAFVYWDDQFYVYENPMVAAGLTWRGVGWAFTTGHAANWHPLTWLSHMLDVQLYGMHAGGHHITNLLLHIVNTLLLFHLLHRMTGAVGRSGFVAALFAVHPLHVESVAWVAERKDVLSTLFWIVTIWCYVDYVRRPERYRYALVVVFLALGLMAKPMLVTLPFVLLLLDYWPLGRVTPGGEVASDSRRAPFAQLRTRWLHLVREKTPLFALAAAASLITFTVQRHGGAVIRLEAAPLGVRAQNALVAYVAYIADMVWPVRLAAFYPYVGLLPFWQVIGAALILIGGVAVAWRAAPRRPYLLVGWLWYLGTLVPVIGLVQVGIQRMADRYTYIPLIGVFIIVAWGAPELVARWRHRQIALAATAVLVLTGCATTARGQVQTWANSVALWQHTVDVTRDNFFAHRQLAYEFTRQRRLDEAMAHYVEVVRIKPGWADAHVNLANALAEAGRLDEGVAHYSEALRLSPDLEQAHNGLAVALMRQGKGAEGLAHFAQALRVKPDYADARHNLAMALVAEGRLDEAFPEMLKAVQLNPNEAGWYYDLAGLYRRKGDAAHTAHYLQKALALNPNDEAARRAFAELQPRR